MLRRLSVWLLACGGALTLHGQTFDCAIDDFRVVSATEVRFRCKRQLNAAPTQTPEIQQMAATGEVAQHLPAQFQYNAAEKHWLPVTVPGGHLQANLKYRLFVPGAEPTLYPFHTKADTTVVDIKPGAEYRYRVATKVAIDWTTSGTRTIGTVQDHCNRLTARRL